MTELKITLYIVYISIIVAKPIVMVEDVFVRPNDTAHLVCNCSSYPESIITWRFVPCRLTPTWPTCDDTLALRLDDKSKVNRSIEIKSLTYLSTHIPIFTGYCSSHGSSN